MKNYNYPQFEIVERKENERVFFQMSGVPPTPSASIGGYTQETGGQWN